jgi:hypothetical protein
MIKIIDALNLYLLNITPISRNYRYFLMCQIKVFPSLSNLHTKNRQEINGTLSIMHKKSKSFLYCIRLDQYNMFSKNFSH